VFPLEFATMGSIPDPGELSELTQPSFDEFQRQTSLMTSCTLLWKELSDHFSSLEEDLKHKSEALKRKMRTLDSATSDSLRLLDRRETSLDATLQIALRTLDTRRTAALSSFLEDHGDDDGGEVDDATGLVLKLKSFCLRMDAFGFWTFLSAKKKELDGLRAEVPVALAECVDPAKFVLEAISEVFPVDKRGEKAGHDLGWACVLVLESLIPVVVDPVIGKSRLLVTPTVKEQATEIAETWKASLEERGGVENVKTPDVHTFLQHVVTFGIVKNEDLDLYRKLVIASAWRKQMPKLALSLGLTQQMPGIVTITVLCKLILWICCLFAESWVLFLDMIEELISKGQQLDAVHFTYEVGLVDKFPPVPLLKSFLKDAKKVAASILEDPNNAGRAAVFFPFCPCFCVVWFDLVLERVKLFQKYLHQIKITG